MEYFAASSLLLDQEDPLKAILANLQDGWWEQVILLAGAHSGATNPFRRRLIPAVLELSQGYTRGSSEWVRCLTMAGWLARDMTTRLPAPQREMIEQAFYQAAVDEILSPGVRATLADVLDETDYLHPDLYAFVPIPDSQAPQFYLARYPVTNLQYERFLRRENFADESLWRDFPKYDEQGNFMAGQTWGAQGWDWLQEALKNKDYLVEDGVLLPRTWRDPRFGVARKSAPVVGVSWYEANAYCRWLAAHWQGEPEAESLRAFVPGRQGFTFRLPTEAEWVTAAGGGEQDDRFAWDVIANEVKQSPGSGGKPSKREIAAPPPASHNDITRYANTAESGINRTTPVWTYPQGASPLGVMDMSGHVWEWMANFFDNDRDWTSVRGGSWDVGRNGARVSVRFRVNPGVRNDGRGFRVVFAPHLHHNSAL